MEGIPEVQEPQMEIGRDHARSGLGLAVRPVLRQCQQEREGAGDNQNAQQMCAQSVLHGPMQQQTLIRLPLHLL